MAGNKQGDIATMLNGPIVDEVEWCLCRRYRKSAIKEHLKVALALDKLTPSIVEALIKRARENIRERGLQGPESAKGTALEFYESVIRDEKSKYKDKIAAQKEIDLIHGYKGLGIVTTPEEAARRIREFLAAANNSVGGEADGDASSDGTVDASIQSQHTE